VQSYVPQLELLDHMHGVICHAGHNTVCEALARGLPLVVAPIRDDQPVIARQVIDAGAGIFMRHGKVSPAMARKAIVELLENGELARNARRISGEFATARGEETAAELIVALAMQQQSLSKRAG
jgi:UDP:flavonoid glycosyltransferase YjiC (YdhE family)